MCSAVHAVLVATLAVGALGPARAVCAEKDLNPIPGMAGTAWPAEALVWYDTLGLPDTTGRPYVRVATGQWQARNDGLRENVFIEGFLLDEDATGFTVFPSGVGRLGRDAVFDNIFMPYPPPQVVRLTRKPTGAEHERVWFERIDLGVAARDVLERVRDPVADTQGGWSFMGRPSQYARIFLFACALRQNNLQREAAGLFDVLYRMQLPMNGFEPNTHLRELQRTISAAMLARVEDQMFDPAHSWDEMLGSFAVLERQFPVGDRPANDVMTLAGTYIHASAETLRRMVAEQKSRPARQISGLTPGEQAVEWIYRLRDLSSEDGLNYSLGYAPPDANQKSPAHHLVDLGNSAVPALLDALSDESFTRSRVVSLHAQDPPTAMRVSDYAKLILEFLAGRRFSGGRWNNGKNADVRPEAEAWWSKVRDEGTRQ